MENNSIKISVLLSVYNGDKYLGEAIDSILGQTFKEFEFLIVDDASTDNTLDILSQYKEKDPRVKIISNEINKGLTYNLNLMLGIAKGAYIVRMDADDIASLNRLQVQYDYMESHSEIGVCGSYIETFDQQSGKKQSVKFPETDVEIRAFAFFQSPFCHPSTIIRKAIIDKYHLQYPVKYIKGQDYALWIDLLKYTKGSNIPQVLLRFRRHENCVSNWDMKKMDQKIEMVSSIHKKYLSNYNIDLDEKDLCHYTAFVDRSIPSELGIAEQKILSKVLQNFLFQIGNKEKEIYFSTIHYLSMICFYKFFIKKKIPVTFVLQKLFLKGLIIYVKRTV